MSHNHIVFKAILFFAELFKLIALRAYKRAVRDGNFKLRTTPDTTGVCNVCSELKATMKNSRLPAVERIQASRDKIAHDAEVRVCMLPTT